MRLFTFLIAISFSLTVWSQDGFYEGVGVSCNGNSDGYAELDLSNVYFFCCGYFSPGWGAYPVSCIPFQVFWFNGSSYPNQYNLSAGVYDLTICDACGDSAVIEVWIPDADPIQFQFSEFNPSCDTCNNGSITTTISGGNPPYIYNWFSGASTSSISNLQWGDYLLTITDDNGCQANQEFFLMHDPPSIQEIVLNAGWNMFSSYKSFDNPPMDSLLSSIEGNYWIVKNGEGEVFWPQYNVNTFDTVEVEYGFQIKMSETDTLLLSGNNFVPENLVIDLPSGWSMIAYPRYRDGAIEGMMNSAMPHIIIMKDDVGSVWWPQYGISLIDTMRVGEAYQLKTDTVLSFSYPSYFESH